MLLAAWAVSIHNVGDGVCSSGVAAPDALPRRYLNLFTIQLLISTDHRRLTGLRMREQALSTTRLVSTGGPFVAGSSPEW